MFRSADSAVSEGDFQSFYRPFRRHANQRLIQKALLNGFVQPAEIAELLRYPLRPAKNNPNRMDPTATFWEDWRAVRGARAMDSREAEKQRKGEKEPLDISTLTEDDHRWEITRDTPEGFRAFCNHLWPKEQMPDHIFTIVQAAYDYERRRWKPAVILNVFPESGKSIYFARRWSMWRVACNRDWRIGIISETQQLANDWVQEIADELTDNAELIADFGPFQDDKANSWRPGHGMLKVKGASIGVRWNVIARGRDTQIQGMRLDEVVIDDPETPDTIMTSEDRAKVVKRLDYVIENRLSKHGVLRLIATRFDLKDIPGILSERMYKNGKPQWEHISFPALVDPVTGKASIEEDAVSLWPENWPVSRLRDKIERLTEVLFEPVFQQNPRPAGAATFDMAWIFGEEGASDARRGCLDRDRPLGLGADDEHWSGDKIRVVGLDPSGTAGFWALVVADVPSRRDAPDFRAVIVDIRRGKWTTQAFLDQFESVCEASASTGNPVAYFIPESNMRADLWNGQNRDFTRIKVKHGFKISPHRTDTNKRDLLWGVESLALDFFDGRIRIPYGDERARRDVCKQLLTEIYEHRAERRTTDDILMALWFIKYGWRALQAPPKDVYGPPPENWGGVPNMIRQMAGGGW